MAHGWSTKKTGSTFQAKVYRHTEEGVEILQTGKFSSRAKASCFAKRWVLFYRRKAA